MVTRMRATMRCPWRSGKSTSTVSTSRSDGPSGSGVASAVAAHAARSSGGVGARRMRAGPTTGDAQPNVEPSKRWADVVIPEGGFNRVAVDLVISHIVRLLGAVDSRAGSM